MRKSEGDLAEMCYALCMNSDMIERVRARWGKFTKFQLSDMKDDLEDLVKSVQNAYGCSRSRAELEVHDFRRSIRPAAVPHRGRPY